MKRQTLNAQRSTPNAQWQSPRILLVFVTMLVIGVWCSVLFGATEPGGMVAGDGKPHGAMEFFGIGPELFGNRGVEWVKALAAIIKEAVAELGFIAAAVILLIKNVKQGTAAEQKVAEVKQDITDRLDRQGARLDAVALAVPVVPGAQPPDLNIENANVQIQPGAEGKI